MLLLKQNQKIGFGARSTIQINVQINVLDSYQRQKQYFNIHYVILRDFNITPK